MQASWKTSGYQKLFETLDILSEVYRRSVGHSSVLCPAFYVLAVSTVIYIGYNVRRFRDWLLITERGESYKRGGGKGGGAEKVLAILKGGGHKKSWGSFTR